MEGARAAHVVSTHSWLPQQRSNSSRAAVADSALSCATACMAICGSPVTQQVSGGAECGYQVREYRGIDRQRRPPDSRAREKRVQTEMTSGACECCVMHASS